MRSRQADHVLFILPDFSGGGAQRVVLAVAQAALGDGRKVEILVMNGKGPLSTSVPNGATVTDLKTPHLRRAIPALRRAIILSSADVALSTINYLNTGTMMAMLGRSQPPIILREANQPSAIFAAARQGGGVKGLGAKLRLMATRLFYPRAAGLLSPSAVVADEMAEWYRVSRKNVRVIPNPVDEDRLRGLAAEARPTRGEKTRFVAAGRLTRQKGYDRLLDDLAGLNRAGQTEWQCEILGEGEDRTELEAQSRALGLETQVSFPGFDTAPWGRIAAADAFLLPSRWEGMPNAALEALALGTPVIATPEAGGIIEIADAVHEEGNSDAVILAKSGASYRDALSLVVQRIAGQPASRSDELSASLLPAPFRHDAVMAAYLTLLDEIAERGQEKRGQDKQGHDKRHQEKS